MDRWPRAGVTGAVSAPDSDVCWKVGRIPGLDAAALDRSSGIGGGGGDNFVQKRIKNCVFVCNIWSLYGRAFM